MIVEHPGGLPISDVHITVSGAQILGLDPPAPDPVEFKATTDEAGRVVFPNLPEGTYGIRAERNGFFDSIVNGTAKMETTASASLAPVPGKQPVQHVRLRMIQAAIISGRVQDENHRPARGVRVETLQVTYQFGLRTLHQIGTAVQTDDLGAFRLFWFGPGEYYLRATTAAAALGRGEGPAFSSSPNFPQFDVPSGTNDPAEATPCSLKKGRNTTERTLHCRPRVESRFQEPSRTLFRAVELDQTD